MYFSVVDEFEPRSVNDGLYAHRVCIMQSKSLHKFGTIKPI